MAKCKENFEHMFGFVVNNYFNGYLT